MSHLTSKIVTIFTLNLLGIAHASEPTVETAATAQCAELEKFEGDVQILNETRDEMIKTHIGSKIPCGGWISVSSGWVKVKHKSDYLIKTGSETLFELFDNVDGIHTSSDDHVVLLRGSLFIDSNRKKELRIVTANSRVRLISGKVVINYNRETDETQLFSVTDHASLENRFETSRKVDLKRGEISSMNFQENRVVPSAAKAVNIASLKKNLNRLPLSTQEYKGVLRLAQGREKRRMPEDLNKSMQGRKIASNTKEKVDEHSYTMSPEEKKAYSQWKKKLIGGIDDMKIFFPDEEAQRRISQDESKFVQPKRPPKKKIDQKKLMEEKKELIKQLKGVHVE